MTKFILVGGYAGKTINLGGHQFVEGVFDYGPTPDGVYPSDQEVALKADSLAKNYQAYIEDSEAHKAALKKLEGGEAPSNGELELEKREQAEQQKAGEAVTQRQQQGAIRSALTKLDPKDDAHWTSTGLPSVEAVRELSGDKEVSRAQIAELAPKLTREEALKLAAGDPLDT